MAQQTAVEWLFEQYKKDGFLCSQDEKQAKEKEKEQIEDAYMEGAEKQSLYPSKSAVQYYNETYGK